MLLRPFLNDAGSCASYLFGCTTHKKLAVVDPHVDLVDRPLPLRQHVDDLRPPAAAERLGHRCQRVEQRRLRPTIRHTLNLSLE